jgi:hypothetical protein
VHAPPWPLSRRAGNGNGPAASCRVVNGALFDQTGPTPSWQIRAGMLICPEL